MRWLLATIISIAVAVDTYPAIAGPFAVVARYGATTKDIKYSVTMQPGAEIPEGGTDAALQQIVLRFDKQTFGLLPTAAFESLTASIDIGGKACRPPAEPIKQLEKAGEVVICQWDRSRAANHGVIHAHVRVQAKLSTSVLCALETRYRELHGVDNPTNPTLLAGLRALYLDDNAVLPARRIMRGADPVYATYCGHRLDQRAFDDEKDRKAWGAEDAEGVEAKQKEYLLERLTPSIKTLFPLAQFRDTAPSAPSEDFDFAVFRAGEIFGAYESSPDGQIALSSVVDVDSDLSFSASHDSGYCPEIRKPPFRYTVGIVGDDKTVAEITPKPMERCEIVLPIELTKLHDKRLRVRALYETDGGERMPLYERELTAHALGFSWSAPVVSEIRAAVNGWSKDEFRAQSSLPLSWAVGLGNDTDNGIALTIPAKITYATRKNPNLAEMFAFYPHISVLVTDEDDGKTPVTFAAGVGFALVNSFYFSYALGVHGPHDGDHFILIGLDIKDLAGLKP